MTTPEYELRFSNDFGIVSLTPVRIEDGYIIIYEPQKEMKDWFSDNLDFRIVEYFIDGAYNQTFLVDTDRSVIVYYDEIDIPIREEAQI